jgi:signal transduction histidine kinase
VAYGRTFLDQPKENRAGFAAAGSLSKSVLNLSLDAISLPVALLDKSGRIGGANAAWRKNGRTYGRNVAIGRVGANFLRICEKVISAEFSDEVARLFAGAGKTVERDYSITLNGMSHDFRARVVGLSRSAPRLFLVTHQDISDFVQARESARELAQQILEIQAEERQRFATELHDSIGQYFVSLELALSRLRIATRRTGMAAKTIREMSLVLKEAQGEIRTLSYLMCPPWVEHECGLEQAIRQFVQGFATRAELQSEIRIEGPPGTIERSRQLTLFRIIQEALVNVHRHAKADSVVVTLATRGKNLMLQVSDNGVGFARAGSGGFSPGAGLTGMRARITHFGGELHIHSGIGGTVLTATLPIE